jgi:hypothetical protein
MQDARKSNIPGFTRGSSSKNNEEKKMKVEGQGSSSDGIKELTQLIKQMELNHANQIKQMEINQANQMNAMQNRLIAMERGQASRPQHRPNDKWPKKNPPQDQRPPNPFESTNLVDHQAIPYCRPCGQFHEESTCQVFLHLCDEMGSYRAENEQVNMFGHEYNVGMYDWMDLMEHSERASSMNCINDVVMDKATEKFGPKPTPQQVAEMARFRGITYQRNGNNKQDRPQASVLGMPPTPPKSNVYANSELNIDLGGWLNNAKMLVPVSEIMKIPSQREKLLKAIENPSQNMVDRPPAVAYQDAPVILQNMDRGNEKNNPFYLSLLMNDFILHNCMLDSGATSNIMTKKVMEQLNLRTSRPYHNICAMDSKTIQVHGLIKGLQVHLAAFPDIMIEMDIVVIDAPDAWGMLLSRKTAADLGGNLQMDLTYATIPTPNGSMFRLNRELYRKYHVEDPRKKDNEIVYREVEMGCYEVESTSLTSTKMKIKDELPSVCNVWDTMDSFDGLFLEEDLDKVDNDLTPSELKSELNFSVENVSSTQPSSEESVRYPEEWYGILGPHPPCFSEIGKIKDRLCDDNMMENRRDDKVSYDNIRYTIPMKRYAKPFKEKLSSETCHLAPMKSHQKFFKGDNPKWSKVRNWDSHGKIRNQDKVYQSSSNSSQPVGRHKVRHASERTPP